MSKIKSYWMDQGELEQWQFDEARQAALEDFRTRGFWHPTRFSDSPELRRVYEQRMSALMQEALKADYET